MNENDNHQRRIALLIDAENISAKYAEIIFKELEAHGFVTYRRLYGERKAIEQWRENVRKYAMTPMLQMNYTEAKNASDTALIIDAMDILYKNEVNVFCLVTSDSDFTKLAIRLREAGMLVIGMGERKAPESLILACEEFKYLDILRDSFYLGSKKALKAEFKSQPAQESMSANNYDKDNSLYDEDKDNAKAKDKDNDKNNPKEINKLPNTSEIENIDVKDTSKTFNDSK